MEVGALWRFPVKSMAGESPSSLVLDPGGVRGDRAWSLQDVERGTTVSARRLPAVLRLRSRFATEPAAPVVPGRVPPVVVTLPDGGEVHSDDPQVSSALSAALDREVRLVPLSASRGDYRLSWRERLTSFTPGGVVRDLGIADDERLPDLARMRVRAVLRIVRYATPPGSFVDLSPVHVLTDASLRTLAEALGDDDVDARRFRPNLLLSGAPTGLPEAGWTGARLDVERSRASVLLTMPTVRCVVPSRAQADVELDRRMTRTVAAVGERYLGAYGEVARPGVVRVGDAVRLDEPGEPGPAVAAVRAARDGALRGAVRLADLTRRR